jgi:hypothetical protein
MEKNIMSSKNYINNADFLKSLNDYREKCNNATKNNLPEPKIPNYIGECFLKIAEGLSTKGNFAKYPMVEDMIGDGVENCIMYFRNFDPERKNPFAYFTQIIFYAFLRKIQKEKKQLYIRYKATELYGILDEFELLENEDGSTVQFEMYDNISEFIEKYETAKNNKKIQKKPKGIEKFIEE